MAPRRVFDTLFLSFGAVPTPRRGCLALGVKTGFLASADGRLGAGSGRLGAGYLAQGCLSVILGACKIRQRAHVIREPSHVIRESWRPKKQLKTAIPRHTWLSGVIRGNQASKFTIQQRAHVIRELSHVIREWLASK
ncbi:hypothetical protein PIB30_067914 [Stylosanthes scabra]|uniref:Uncharacterized protein n=1 Tax=Stylosanthes scabra TaxID=79078 RepID=A0ABU6ZLG3_9FABA|nr:hypothetical protein [Stylosanthes scabra]